MLADSQQLNSLTQKHICGSIYRAEDICGNIYGVQHICGSRRSYLWIKLHRASSSHTKDNTSEPPHSTTVHSEL